MRETSHDDHGDDRRWIDGRLWRPVEAHSVAVLRRRVHRHLIWLPDRVVVPGRQQPIARSDLRAVLDALFWHVRQSDWTLRLDPRGTDALTVVDLAREVGLSRRTVGATLTLTDDWHLTTHAVGGGRLRMVNPSWRLASR